MSETHSTKRLRLVGGLLFVLGVHLAISAPGQLYSNAVPLFAILLAAELVRDFLARRHRAADDDAGRARRKRLSMVFAVLAVASLAGTVATIALVPRPNKVVGWLLIALFVGFGYAALGVLTHDLQRSSARKIVEERREAPVVARILVPLLPLAILGYASWNAWSEWLTLHTMSLTRIAGLGLLTVMTIVMSHASLRSFDEWDERAQEYLSTADKR